MVDSSKGVTQIELVEDSIILNEEFKKNVAIPYFKDIYRDLVSQSDSKTKGINKVTLLTVSCEIIPDVFFLVYISSWNHR